MFLEKLPDKEWGHIFLEGLNLEAQQAAVRSLIRRNRQADAALSAEIDDLAAQAKAASEEHSWIAEDIWVGQMEHSVYHDAAHSMAAVGMLAPMMEALFTHLFRLLGEEAGAKAEAAETKLTDRARRADADYWDPHVVFDSKGRRESLVDGILQLAGDTGLKSHLPADYGRVLQGLFQYRNMMFHNGFEWPLDRRHAFAAFLKNQSLPADWFTHSSSGGEPWIHYMTPAFVDRCLTLVDEVMTALGKVTRPQAAPAPPTG